MYTWGPGGGRVLVNSDAEHSDKGEGSPVVATRLPPRPDFKTPRLRTTFSSSQVPRIQNLAERKPSTEVRARRDELPVPAGRGGAAPSSPAQSSAVLTERARAAGSGSARVPAPDGGLPVRSKPRHARAPKLPEEGAGPAGAGSTGRGRGTRDSRAQGDRGGFQVVC